ncbi:unnamed protein product [Penicillium salamii]|uniref:Uncharacterized protein n=1 Tax=Penicillium salamii TaxID=1612424 RepID=A0A9W4NAH4_9EURO|nr:unnamed protein product [Penicillium salamii]CAG8028756.1 unnamed protein product [Penicillium salamii]CAG8035463.1 unnamed protein product [Penicillium salamii]CAG8057424.1 unnamed protein product [Penicillium salamii]CAG8085416.1 unnamed protein product [Penicillium salamii]
MARSVSGILGQPSMLLLLAFLATLSHGSGHTFDTLGLLPRSSDSCPASYVSCSNTKLPDDFCCPSDSTCISLDDASSAICCPAGQQCDYIIPITCDMQQQNVTLHPESVIKSTRLGDSLAKCGDLCCPFGYTCQGDSTCALDKTTAITATASTPSSSTALSKSTQTTTTAPTTPQATITPVSSPSAEKSANTTTTPDLSGSCPEYPAGAIAVGFFPGAIFGAIAALLITLCARRRVHKHETQIQEPKPRVDWTQRSSSGALMGISNPIPQDDTSYRTEFLRSPPRAKRSSIGSRSTRSMMHRTGSRVRSLFSGYPRTDPRLDKDVPPVPAPVPVAMPNPDAPFTPPRQRQPSTESIKIYSPPGVFTQPHKFLGPEPYPGAMARPDTAFTDLMHAGSSQDGRKLPYPTHEDSRENPFRDPTH